MYASCPRPCLPPTYICLPALPADYYKSIPAATVIITMMPWALLAKAAGAATTCQPANEPCMPAHLLLSLLAVSRAPPVMPCPVSLPVRAPLQRTWALPARTKTALASAGATAPATA
jgi:hypothetical protein